ncbi:MAG: Uncharacterised protein [Cryomorphaceae bacterium]|nr:MAG: Uncharacterised protein [Cryomorphaceae bacterium]
MTIDRVKSEIQEVRAELIAHDAFTWVDSLEKAQHFMEYHVWAVWDFMVLLKGLQRELTCTDTYWVPKGNAAVRRLINEIVWGEESDEDRDGRAMSHFEMYLEAMQEAGAETQPIRNFILDLQNGVDPKVALAKSKAPVGAKKFVLSTLEVVERGQPHEMAAVFTFGREDLIPDMFMEIVAGLKTQFPDKLGKFTYYLERHIEVDGDVHGHLAEQMVEQLCAEDENKWLVARDASLTALQARIELWTKVLASFRSLHLA